MKGDKLCFTCNQTLKGSDLVFCKKCDSTINPTMKVTVTPEKEKEDITFPCLMKSTGSDTIILATGYYKGKHNYKAVCLTGKHAGNQDMYWNIYAFEPYEGKVTLETSKN